MTDEQEKRERDDMAFLNSRPEFRRYQLRVIQLAGLFSRTTDGSVVRSLDYFEGRRSLGLDLLDMAERGQPIPEIHPSGAPLLTIFQAIREETQQPATEKPNGRRKPYDRNADLAGDDDDQ